MGECMLSVGRGWEVGGEEGERREGDVKARGRWVGVAGEVHHERRQVWRVVVAQCKWHPVSVTKPVSSVFLAICDNRFTLLT